MIDPESYRAELLGLERRIAAASKTGADVAALQARVDTLRDLLGEKPAAATGKRRAALNGTKRESRPGVDLETPEG